MFWLKDQTVPYVSWQTWKIYSYARKFLSPWHIFSWLLTQAHVEKRSSTSQILCLAPSVTSRIQWFQQQNWFLRVITLWSLVLFQTVQTVWVPFNKNTPNFNFLAVSKLRYRIYRAQRLKLQSQLLKLHIHFTKSPKLDNNNKLFLRKAEVSNCLIISSQFQSWDIQSMPKNVNLCDNTEIFGL